MDDSSKPSEADKARIAELLRALDVDAGAKRAQSRFSTFGCNSDYQRLVVTKVRQWADEWEHRRNACEGLVLYGPVGTGKDHLAYSAVRQIVIKHSVPVIWANGREIASKARASIDDDAGEAWIDRFVSIPLLVLSDPLPALGELSVFQADTLYRIIESRDARGLPTVTTVNVADDAEADRRLGAATWDRVCHRAWKIACRWPSHRKPAFELKP